MKKLQKYPLGGLALGLQGANLLMSGIGALSARSQAKKAALTSMRNDLNNQKQQDLLEVEEFEEQGNDIRGYYKMGGDMKIPFHSIKGGKAIPLSSDSLLMKGRKHKDGGIILNNNTEVEDDEVIMDGNKVFSDVLTTSSGKTFAEEAEMIARKKGDLEENPNDNYFLNNSKKRKKQILDAKQDALFEEQEAGKMKNNYSYMKEGGFAKALTGAVPYLDNVVNAGLTFLTPKVPTPTYLKARRMDTNVNVAPQLNEVNDAVNSTSKLILDNTSNSAAARNAIGRTKLQAADSKARILSNKENQETALKNANSRNLQYIDSINANKRDNYNQMVAGRQANINSKISANFADLSNDVIDSRNFDEQKRFNNEQIAAIESMYSSDLIDRTKNLFLERLKRLSKN